MAAAMRAVRRCSFFSAKSPVFSSTIHPLINNLRQKSVFCQLVFNHENEITTTTTTSVLSSILIAANVRPYSSSAAPSPHDLTTTPNEKNNIIFTGNHYFNESDYAWNPLKVKNFGSLMDEALQAPSKLGDKNHWLVHVDCEGIDSFSEKELFDFYAKTITYVIGVDRAQAKLKIYLVSCERPYGYGAEFDMATQKCLAECGVELIREDRYHSARIKDGSVQPVARFTAFNLDSIIYNDLYSYHFFRFEPNIECKSDHWLVHLKDPECLFSNYTKCIRYCVRLLAEVVGSEDEAKEKIYVVWCAEPFGFGAEIDMGTVNKLKVLQDVLALLPDYSVSCKYKDEDGFKIKDYDFTKWGLDFVDHGICGISFFDKRNWRPHKSQFVLKREKKKAIKVKRKKKTELVAALAWAEGKNKKELILACHVANS
ncbi:hypothetical protein IFM89_000760 [Coptis chinensis]|uniref:MORF/ORRM1/DAG-like MORF domain-containing protein n=1 Tax=Coptis chinensis TaxID=261450 RepID=A0A835ITA8_9MAGN|nr:hypothetical protein IFM89_000760 [Coptis chinensis]